MAKILFLCHRVPFPPNKGDKIRSFNEIKHLSKRHEIHLLAFCDDAQEVQYKKELEKYCRTVALIPLLRWKQRLRAGYAMSRSLPWSLGYFADPAMKRAVSDKLAGHSFDLIFVYCSSMAPYAATAKSIPRILDFVDSDSLKWAQYSEFHRPPKSWLYGYESRKLSHFELNMIEQFDCSIFVSPSEIAGRDIDRLEHKIAFMQNGIDLEFFKPSLNCTSPPAAAFTGAMDYYPNIDAVLYFTNEIFPKIRSTHPDAKFFIIGSRPAAAVQKLSSIPGTIVTGTVQDVRPFLSQCRVAVVPLRIAQGIQNKILEALAVGLPVVTTPIAAGGLTAIKGLPLSAAADPDSFANQAIDYMTHSPLRKEIVDLCRHHLRSHYDWETNFSALDRIIGRVTLKRPQAASVQSNCA